MVKMRVCSCGSQAILEGQPNGFSLLEVVLSIGLGALVLTSSLSVALTLIQGTHQWLGMLEVSSMSANLQRVMAQDIHCSSAAGFLYNQLTLTTLNGKNFRYFLNQEGQLIRVQSGGGTAVLAEGIAAFDVSLIGTLVKLDVSYKSGRTEELVYSTAEALNA